MKVKHPIRQYREDRALSQADLAHLLGVKATTVYRWERGMSVPRRGQWERISELTGVTPAQLAAYHPEAA